MLVIHRAERADPLVVALGELLASPSGDPFAAEVVAVPTMGVERWLAQQLSHRLGAVDGDGVCANVVFPSSAKLLDDALAATHADYAASVEAWAAERAVWPLMSIIDSAVIGPAHSTAPWADALASHLGGTHGLVDRGRRFAVSSKVARYFESYARARPAMLIGWRDGSMTTGDPTTGGTTNGGTTSGGATTGGADYDERRSGAAVPDDLAWQAHLWRLLRAELGPSPAELLEPACAALRVSSEQLDLPQRLSIFGTTRISPTRVAALGALAETREVHLWLHHPSPTLWQTLKVAGTDAGRRRDDRASGLVRNPLLASMSRDIRELQQLLPRAARDIHHAVPARANVLLGTLQADLALDHVPAERGVIAETDESLSVHACHGAARQVEVVREVILGLLAGNATLEPRDILIMCPDVETFAPLVAASFGMLDDGGHPAARLRVRLADRSLRQTNPLLTLLSQLLELSANRVTATQLLDLAGAPPVRAMFAFTDDDIEQLRDWATAANARWGLDRAHRAMYGLGDLDQGTWRAALDRLLLGVAMEEGDSWIGPVLPLDDVDSNAIDLAGRFAELLDRVDSVVRALANAHSVAGWAALLVDLVLSVGEPAQAWQAVQLRSELGDLADDAGDTDVRLTRADVSLLLASRLAGRPTRASFRTGTLTVCTLVPMRSVPHRVVCLVGMDDGAFPRQGLVDGDDLLARDPRSGERDVRSEDRQLFLDAICAAQEHLVITYTGADPRSGVRVPPCVPLGELLDAVDAIAVAADGRPGREHVVVRHPLQPFDPRNFVRGELGSAGPFSFDPAGLAGARAASQPRRPVPPLVAGPLPPMAEAAIELDDLVRFVQHPARAFLRQRLGISTYDVDDEPVDALPVELDGLTAWAVGDRILRNCLTGMTRETCVELERRRGDLPPGPLGRAKLRDIGSKVDALLHACELERRIPAQALDVAIRLPDGRRLSGTIGGVRGATVLSVSYSSLAGKHRLAAWVRHLALVVSLGDSSLRSVTVGRHRSGARRSLLQGIDAAGARRVLTDLVALRDEGLREPLPMAVEASEAYADRRYRGDDRTEAGVAARDKWQTNRFQNENAEPEHVLVHGRPISLAELMALPGDGGPDEPTRFGVLARQLWTPLLNAEIDVQL